MLTRGSGMDISASLQRKVISFAVLLGSCTAMSQNQPQTGPCLSSPQQVRAQFVSHAIRLDAANPASEWKFSPPITFCTDWQGKNADPQRQTEVRLLWTRETLYLRFECHFRSLYTFDDAEANGRRDHLWDRDVAEVFLQPDAHSERLYKEFEIAPNGMWIDLDISPGPLRDLRSGMKRSVSIDRHRSVWLAEVAIPMPALTPHFDPNVAWRTNFYRVEGNSEPRAYLAWRPTNTPQPNFHVPEAFGKLEFSSAPKP